MSSEGYNILGKPDVGKNGQITVPDEVRKIIFEAGDLDGGVYYWYLYSWEYNIVYMADKPSIDDKSERIGTTEARKYNKKRTTLPNDIRQMKDIEVGDTIYLFAPKGIKNEKNPSVAVVTEEMIEKIFSEWKGKGDAKQFDREVYKDETDISYDISPDGILEELYYGFNHREYNTGF